MSGEGVEVSGEGVEVRDNPSGGGPITGACKDSELSNSSH